MAIVTSLCVDTAGTPASVYPQLLDVGVQERRRLYWQCTVVFFATSVRCNPGVTHLFYTNDEAPACWGGIDYRAFLEQLGVQTRLLPFEEFCPPPAFGTEFRNAFYKLEVLREMARPEAEDGSILLDSDCVWTRPAPALLALLRQPGTLLLLDAEPDTGPDTKVHGLSRRDIGNLYRQLDPTYPVAVPHHYGGELLGGSRPRLAEVAAALEVFWKLVLRSHPTAAPRFASGRSLFDGDEYLTSFVYNRLERPGVDASPFIRRIWTSYRKTNVRPTDLQLPIWHLPNEKNQGLPILCQRVLNPHSAFWSTPTTDLATYLGRFLGIPQPLWHPQRLLIMARKLPRLLVLLRRQLSPPARVALSPG
ncbi:hypothetical protein [Hymenobacter sp. BT190]|uniref:hypothetical protein n=1 Tax=Hymenobacter sp. BT190 TaxID=2763505 RepID=UPI0016517438|nr:hypothetical protein [Hymenobacter sp. BT190]MBC6699253.1 hypothetical protein [Hymenobacter sp. BT190]